MKGNGIALNKNKPLELSWKMKFKTREWQSTMRPRFSPQGGEKRESMVQVLKSMKPNVPWKEWGEGVFLQQTFEYFSR